MIVFRSFSEIFFSETFLQVLQYFFFSGMPYGMCVELCFVGREGINFRNFRSFSRVFLVTVSGVSPRVEGSSRINRGRSSVPKSSSRIFFQNLEISRIFPQKFYMFFHQPIYENSNQFSWNVFERNHPENFYENFSENIHRFLLYWNLTKISK